MMDDSSVQVLRDIYRAVQGTNTRLDDTIGRLDETNTRLDETNTRLGSLETKVGRLEDRVGDLARRQTESEMRIATELVAVANLLREKLDDHNRVDDHEQRITRLERKAS